jgi:hypothetical protein
MASSGMNKETGEEKKKEKKKNRKTVFFSQTLT